jgi:hypothetical protein
MAPLLKRIGRRDQPIRRPFFQKVSVALMAAASLFMLGIVVGTLTLERSAGLPPSGASVRMDLLAVDAPSERSRVVLDHGELAHGEQVLFAPVSATHRYLAIVSLDATGTVTAHLPASGRSVNTSRFGPRALAAGKLAGTGPERFIAVFTDHPIELEVVARAARETFVRAGRLDRMARLDLPGEQVVRTVLKPTP